MSRIVVVIGKPGNKSTFHENPQFLVSLSEPPPRSVNEPAVVSMRNALDFLERIEKNDLSGDAIQKIGTELFNLLNEHRGFYEEVPHILKSISPQPVYVLIKENAATELDQLPWETLHSPDAGFLCANSFFPVARAKEVKTTSPDWGFEPPLKIMVVLGAHDEENAGDPSASSRDEWQGLHEALKEHCKKTQTGTHGITSLDVKVLHFDEQLLHEIESKSTDRIEISTGILTDEEKLYHDISDYKPHILHFFSHGQVDSISRLCIRNYWEQDFKVNAETLSQYIDTDLKPWLVVLNSCESALQANGAGSRSLPMAASLVSMGFPAAIGMREQVRTDLAHLFCGSFYSTLLEYLSSRIKNAKEQGGAEVHWACALFKARRKLCTESQHSPFEEAAPHAKEWTIPVVYTDLHEFTLRVSSKKRRINKLKEEVKQIEEDELEIVRPLVKRDLSKKPILDTVVEKKEKVVRMLKEATDSDPSIHSPPTSPSKQNDARNRHKPSEKLLEFPHELRMNAFAGNEAAVASLADKTTLKRWLANHSLPRVRTFLKAAPNADPRDWRDHRVGWGLILPDVSDLPAEDKAWARDAPEPIQALVKSRGEAGRPAPVLRFKAGHDRIGFLHRDGIDLPISESLFGTGRAAIPRYLLIYGSPHQIPWEVQYGLNAGRAVGRLTLEGDALENYVSALMNDWKEERADFDAAVVWATDHGTRDITSLMRKAIAKPIAKKLECDSEVGPKTAYFDGSRPRMATAEKLANVLAERQPGFIVTTSHGMTAPLDNVALLEEQIGLPVDSEHSLVRPHALLERWKPGGAIWYAHACCSAGSDARTMFDGLFAEDSAIDRVLKGITKIGARVAPLPTALLGARRPLRAFVGHVEPTFDWTLQQRATLQFTTAQLATSLYDNLFQPYPVGLAMGNVFGQLGGIYSDYDRFSRIPSIPDMVHRLLVARDIQSTVILGDPTAVLPI